MCADRVTSDGQRQVDADGDLRSPFERDWDRILFSPAFRRLHDKTQVFPLPIDDFVHSRLTHSLEAASVGRSLGAGIARHIAHKAGVPSHDFAAVTAAACLAHDIGNPPFGHSGEAGIQAFFRGELGRVHLAGLEPREKCDLQEFEGNAQGFRNLVRLQQEESSGLKLTAATLAAFSKYPRESGKDLVQKSSAGTKKHGFFQADSSVFESVAKAVGLTPVEAAGDRRAWCRHPLAYLIEAADDICYSILDLEDGVKLKYVSAAQAIQLLQPIARTLGPQSEMPLPYHRAKAIGNLVGECVQQFVDSEMQLLAGRPIEPLCKSTASAAALAAIQDFTRTHCYRASDVLEIELAGHEAIACLLGRLVPAALSERPEPSNEFTARHLLNAWQVNIATCRTAYERILRVTDLISGMTDRYALTIHRRLSGSALPGRLA